MIMFICNTHTHTHTQLMHCIKDLEEYTSSYLRYYLWAGEFGGKSTGELALFSLYLSVLCEFFYNANVYVYNF